MARVSSRAILSALSDAVVAIVPGPVHQAASRSRGLQPQTLRASFDSKTVSAVFAVIRSPFSTNTGGQSLQRDSVSVTSTIFFAQPLPSVVRSNRAPNLANFFIASFPFLLRRIYNFFSAFVAMSIGSAVVPERDPGADGGDDADHYAAFGDPAGEECPYHAGRVPPRTLTMSSSRSSIPDRRRADSLASRLAASRSGATTRIQWRLPRRVVRSGTSSLMAIM